MILLQILLVITDNTFILQKFEKLIAELDVPARQVMVEARIVEAEDGFSRQLGVKFGYAGSMVKIVGGVTGLMLVLTVIVI